MIEIEVPEVTACAEAGCAYNAEGGCHAQAITIGDGVHPGCDTYLVSLRHIHDTSRKAGVGACKVAQCRHNDDLECHAPAIYVGAHDCLTFAPR